jgi:hypothetical protein
MHRSAPSFGAVEAGPDTVGEKEEAPMFRSVARARKMLVRRAAQLIEGGTMTPTSDRDSASELAQRIKNHLIDPSKEDEADRPPGDKPPAFADALMSEAPASIERAAGVNSADWEFIVRALEHYATCGNR